MAKKILPANLKPQPVFVSGNMRLVEGYSGKGLFVLRPSDNATSFIDFLADGSLDVATFDAFRGGQVCRVLVRGEQMAGSDLGAQGADVPKAPKIGALMIGRHRCMYLEGDGQTQGGIPAPPVTGQIYGMSAPAPAVGLGDEVTVMQVIKQHSGMHCNQVRAPGLAFGTTFSLSIAGGEMLRVRVDAEGDSTRGAIWGARQGTDFVMRGSDCVIETCPTILTYICKQGVGTFIGQNEDFRSGFESSNLGLTADMLRIGYHESSPDLSGFSEAGGFSELLTMVWDQALTFSQAAQVRSVLYDLVPIDPRRSRPSAPLILGMTDSLWAGYQGADLRGWMSYAELELPSYVRWANYAVPGSAILPPDPVVFPNHCTSLAFPGYIAQTIKMHKGRVLCVWGTPINDYYITPRPTPQEAYDRGTLGLMALVREVDPDASFIIATNTHATGFENDAWSAQVGDLVRAGGAANGYTMVDFARDPFMSISPGAPALGPAYSDGAHLSDAGHQREWELLQPAVTEWVSRWASHFA